MRFDPEIALADTLTGYIKSILSGDIFETCPAVTFFDPMSIDDADRIVVQVPSCDTMAESAGNFDLIAEVGIKTQWAQVSVTDDMKKHFDRVSALRDILSASNIKDRLESFQPDGFKVDFVNPSRAGSTKVFEGWIFTDTKMQIAAHAD